jgi:hypothetical protein
MAKTNFSYEKRQRELEKKRKAEEKARRKQEAKQHKDEPADGEPVVDDDAASAEQAADTA